MEHIRISEAARAEMAAAHSAGRMAGEMAQQAQRTPVDLSDTAQLKAHLISAHDWDENLFWRNSHEDRHPVLGPSPSDDHQMSHVQLRAVHDRHDHVQYRSDFPGAVTLGHDHFHE